MNALVHAAEQALRDFGARTRYEAEQILPHWRYATGMTEAERAEVLGRFDSQPWPASLVTGKRGGSDG